MADRDDMTPQDGEPLRDKGDGYRPSLFGNIFRGFYDRFRGVPLRYFDIFIGLCIAAIVVIVAVGILQSRGVL